MSGTIAAIATPLGTGGISVIRISGRDAVIIGDRIFKALSEKKLCEIKGYSALFGYVHPQNEIQNKIDDAVALVFKGPKSYTGEDVVEITCHGGIFITQKLLRIIINAGASPAMPGEFTKRAFLNGKISLDKAEAVNEIINANSEYAANNASAVMDGALYKQIESVKEALLDITSHLAAWSDFPEEDVDELSRSSFISRLNSASKLMHKLLANYDNYKIIRNGISTVIAGKPNVGKSTLMNIFTGEQSSIVTEIPGTTRDVIQEYVRVGNLMLKLSDTAGIHETDDIIERMGIERSTARIEEADLVLAVFDASDICDSGGRLLPEDAALIKSIENKRHIIIINKIDKINRIKFDALDLSSYFKEPVFISAKSECGISELRKRISDIAGIENLDGHMVSLINERQYNAIFKAHRCIEESITALNSGQTFDAVNIGVEEALDFLLELSGEKVSERIIDEVFSNFCVGK